jgi:hypothetical protein
MRKFESDASKYKTIRIEWRSRPAVRPRAVYDATAPKLAVAVSQSNPTAHGKRPGLRSPKNPLATLFVERTHQRVGELAKASFNFTSAFGIGRWLAATSGP